MSSVLFRLSINKSSVDLFDSFRRNVALAIYVIDINMLSKFLEVFLELITSWVLCRIRNPSSIELAIFTHKDISHLRRVHCVIVRHIQICHIRVVLPLGSPIADHDALQIQFHFFISLGCIVFYNALSEPGYINTPIALTGHPERVLSKWAKFIKEAHHSL